MFSSFFVINTHNFRSMFRSIFVIQCCVLTINQRSYHISSIFSKLFGLLWNICVLNRNITIYQLIRCRCHFLKSHRNSFSFKVSHFLLRFLECIRNIIWVILLLVMMFSVFVFFKNSSANNKKNT